MDAKHPALAPLGHLGTVLTFAMPFGLLGFIAEASQGKPSGSPLLLCRRHAKPHYSERRRFNSSGSRRDCRTLPDVPLRDLLGQRALGVKISR